MRNCASEVWSFGPSRNDMPISKHAARGERLADVLHLGFIGDHVEHDRREALRRKAAESCADLGIAADEVGAVRLEGQERKQPVAVLRKVSALASLEEPP